MLEGEPEQVRDVLHGGSLRLEEGEKLSALGGEVGREAFNEGVLDAERLSVLSAHFMYPTAQEGSLDADIQSGDRGRRRKNRVDEKT
jgi:hypothetical protein